MLPKYSHSDVILLLMMNFIYKRDHSFRVKWTYWPWIDSIFRDTGLRNQGRVSLNKKTIGNDDKAKGMNVKQTPEYHHIWGQCFKW